LASAPDPIDDLLACPSCGLALTRNRDAHRCEGCAVSYPAIDGIPWLVPDPGATFGEWRLRLARLITRLESDAAEIEAELSDTALAAKTRSRIKLMAGARREHARRLASLLAPLDPVRVQMPEPMHAAFGTPLPLSQDLTSYYVNVHRDWVWGDTENRLGLELATRALGAHPAGRVLVLGAGAGRLAYDLHDAWSAQQTIVADINPLLLLIAARMFRGEALELYEFPIAPRSSECCALLRRLTAPQAARAGLIPLLADASAPPFAAGAFDTVVTPWLIDILEEDLAGFLPRLNRLLRPGGRWINTGSLVFARPPAARQLGLEEVLDLIVAAGFERPSVDESEVPYMRSPASRHGRIETVVTFGTERISPAVAGVAGCREPPWLRDERCPIRRDAATEMMAVSSRIHGFILSLIDGRRSLADIVDLLVEQRLMTREDAEPAIRGFLLRLHEQRSQPRWQ